MSQHSAPERLRRFASVAFALALITVCTGWAGSSRSAYGKVESIRRAPSQSVSSSSSHRVLYPLKVSANRRYLVDQRNVPFMIVGDSPQALIGKLSVKDAAAFFANRRAAGFNALWVNLLCAMYTGCKADGSTFDGIKPFTTPGDLSTPNPVYFRRVDTMIRLAASAGIVVFLDPIETGSWLSVLRNNGVAKAAAYGRFLGKRYKRFTNIVWFNGNDFQTWRDASDDALVLAVARGIRSVDRAHIQTVELNYFESGSLDDARWSSLVGLNAAYTYFPTYARVLKEYNRERFLPVFMVEAGYEFEQNSGSISYGDPQTLRRQEYWTALSGSTGQLYGNHYTWQFADGWKEHLDTPGSAQFGYLARLFADMPWFRLVPDQTHRIVTAGYGTFDSDGSVQSSDYVTTAATPDGMLAVTYLPAGGLGPSARDPRRDLRGMIVVDTARLARPIRGRWFDPTDGTYAPVQGSPFKHAERIRLKTPGTNAAGDRDWVLVLTGSQEGALSTR